MRRLGEGRCFKSEIRQIVAGCALALAAVFLAAVIPTTIRRIISQGASVWTPRSLARVAVAGRKVVRFLPASRRTRSRERYSAMQANPVRTRINDAGAPSRNVAGARPIWTRRARAWYSAGCRPHAQESEEGQRQGLAR